MIQYILECIAFQLVFLTIYDFFLKRETFFQWNRAYLIGTYLFSLILPSIKIESLKTTFSGPYVYPEYLWRANDAATVAMNNSSNFNISWENGLLFGGMFIALLFFGQKMYQLYRFRSNGKVIYFKNFTQIIISNSYVAFSFFKSIFLGDKILEREHKSIIEHELIHIKQRHTYDLLFFELMRIVGWFNPLVYVYQNRMAELHEFIADAQAAKSNRIEHCEMLLSQAFQTQKISFINQFFNSSLIKKRIVMLTKEKSSKIWKLKYLALVPVLLGMLLYTSCEQDVFSDRGSNETIDVDNIENMTVDEERNVFSRLLKLSESLDEWKLTLRDKNSKIDFSEPLNDGSTISGPNGFPIKARMTIESSILKEDFSLLDLRLKGVSLTGGGMGVPFAVVEEVPIFPGCEDAPDPRACFQESMQQHIGNNFRYPEEAQKKAIQGRVSVMFTIDEEGHITNIRKRGPDALLENETVRIIEKLPRMKPGKQNGEAVRVPFSIPINFKLQGSGFNPQSQNTNYVKLQNEKISAMPDDVQKAYQNAIPFSVVEQVPIFPGCEDAPDPRACFQESMQQHISENFRYPEEAQKKGIQGRVSVMFTIDEEGNITNIRKRGPDAFLENETVRIIEKLPQMKPGKQNGEAVRVPFSIPINFKLQ